MEEERTINQETDAIGTPEQTGAEQTPSPEENNEQVMFNPPTFRKNSTPEQRKELAEYLEEQKAVKNLAKSLPNLARGWNFSYPFASSYLQEYGLWEAPERKKNETASVHETLPDMPESRPFSITAFTAGASYDTRSIQIEKNVNAHLKAFLKANAFTRSNAVISQVIAAGLEVYGVDLSEPVTDENEG